MERSAAFAWARGAMNPVRVNQFPIVIYPSEDSDGGKFTAHCLSMDLVADDDCVEGAVSRLLHSIDDALAGAVKHNANVFREAPKEYWERLASAQPLPAELLERIIFDANKRLGSGSELLVDVEKQCDLRQLQTA